MRDKHQSSDSLSKKTKFYERLEQKQANQAEIKEGFSFVDKETYEALAVTRWLDTQIYQWRKQQKQESYPKGPGALRSVATFKPCSTGTLSYEHKLPITAR